MSYSRDDIHISGYPGSISPLSLPLPSPSALQIDGCQNMCSIQKLESAGVAFAILPREKKMSQTLIGIGILNSDKLYVEDQII